MAGYGRGVLRGATSGIGQLLGSLMNGGQAERMGYDNEMASQSKMAQVLAQVQAQQAAARLHDAQAGKASEEAAVLQRRPGIADEVMAATGGVDVPTLNAFRSRLRTGQAPQVPIGPPDETGGMGQGSAQFGAETSSRLGQVLTRLLPILNSENDLNPEQYAKAAGLYGEQDLQGDMLAGRQSPQAVALSQAALKGSPVFHFDTSGQVGNLFTGALDGSSPRALAVTDKERQSAGAQRANAAQSYASADSSRASAAKTRADMMDGANRGGSKAPSGYRWGADGMTLEAIPGGPADPNTKGAKLSKPPTEGQAKALMFGARMAAADDVIGEQEKAGVYRPGNIKTTAQGVAGSIPFIGGALKSAAAAATNWTQSGGQQLTEQAQADFINAILRRESGAVISDQEFSRAQEQYFPEVGDSADRLRQKAANRKTAIAGLKSEFGEAMTPEFDRIVSEARTNRKKPAASQGGAGGSWDEPANPNGWKIERVN